MDIRLELIGGPRAAAAARAAVSTLSGTASTAVLEDVRLLVSELVTNAVRHAGMGRGDRIRLRLLEKPEAIWVEVADTGPGFFVDRPQPGADRASGWGLVLVDRIAHRWGVDGSRVWFEVDPTGSRANLSARSA